MHRDYTYKVITPPADTAVRIALVYKYLRLAPNQDGPIVTACLKAATDFAEKLTRRDFIIRQYETYRDFFPTPSQNEGYYWCGQIPSYNSGISAIGANVGFEIRKSPLRAVNKIEYYSDGQLTLLDPSIYYWTTETDYSEVLTLGGKSWPSAVDDRLQAVRITFTSGMAEQADDVPDDIQGAILQHVAALYSNRGDCSDSACASSLPQFSKSVYLQNRIENL